jgi:hypothetical protein
MHAKYAFLAMLIIPFAPFFFYVARDAVDYFRGS